MPSRWDAATHGWSRRVFRYPLPTLMSRNFRLPCTIELQPLSLTPLKMRKVELGVCKLLWQAVWPTVRSSWGSKKGGSNEPPFVGRFCRVVGWWRLRHCSSSAVPAWTSSAAFQSYGISFPALSLLESVCGPFERRHWLLRHRAGRSQVLLCRSPATWPCC